MKLKGGARWVDRLLDEGWELRVRRVGGVPIRAILVRGDETKNVRLRHAMKAGKTRQRRKIGDQLRRNP